MQRKTVEGKILFKIICGPFGAIAGVADHRVAGQLCMASDLMLAAGDKFNLLVAFCLLDFFAILF